jgi:uncharacterized protein
MQALSSYSPDKHPVVSRALAALESPPEGLTAGAWVTPTGSFARFVWPDLPIATSAKLGEQIAILHNRIAELGLQPVPEESPDWNAVFHGWRTDLEAASAIEKAFSHYFPKRVLWVLSQKDMRGRIAAKCRVEGLGEAVPAPPARLLGLGGSQAPLGIVTLDLSWKDSLVLPPRELSESDQRSLQSSLDAIFRWAGHRIRPVLEALRARLQQLYGERFRSLYVFGSYARPDAGIELPQDSDLDVALVLSNFDNAYDEITRFSEVVSDLSLEHDLVISVIPIREADYKEGHTNFTRVISEYAIPVK